MVKVYAPVDDIALLAVIPISRDGEELTDSDVIEIAKDVLLNMPRFTEKEIETLRFKIQRNTW
jgi:hypothetical protein